MTATTIKIEGEVLREVKQVIHGQQSITSFVRESIQAELKRRKFREAAIQYQEFLRMNKKEASDLKAWETADLTGTVERNI